MVSISNSIQIRIRFSAFPWSHQLQPLLPYRSLASAILSTKEYINILLIDILMHGKVTDGNISLLFLDLRLTVQALQYAKSEIGSDHSNSKVCIKPGSKLKKYHMSYSTNQRITSKTKLFLALFFPLSDHKNTSHQQKCSSTRTSPFC